MSLIPNTFIKFLWYFAKKYKLCLFGFIMIEIIWASTLSLIPYALKLIIDRVSSWEGKGSLFSELTFPALLYVSLFSSIECIFRFSDWLVIKTYPNMQYKIKEEVFNYAENHSYNYFQNNFAGSLANKINDLAKSTPNVISRIIDHFLSRVLSLTIGTATLFFVCPYFAAVLLLWSIIFLSGSIILSKKAQKYAEIFSEARSTVVGKIVDSLGNILNVKLFAQEKYENKYLRKYLEDSASKERQALWYLLKIKTFYTISTIFLLSSMMWLLIHERQHNNTTVGDFALVLTLTMGLIDELCFMVKQLVPFSEEVGTCQQALSIISPKHDIVDIADAKPLKISKGQIIFDKVHFQYKKGQSVFTDKSIIINAGERVGLVGFSGSGKSTFVNLILRFFDVDSGKILIDGQDIKTVTQESLRSQIAMIPQDPVLFHRSLAENISYGCLDASEEEIIAASKKAHCHEFIEKLQGKYQSLVGERGVKLSGGQRQRVAIARAILKNAPILILDEATSSLDSVTENYIQESLVELMEQRTTLVIAHRLSTLFHMNRILVFSEGKIIEDGTHAELLNLNGHYAKLWDMQVGGFIGNPPDDNNSKKEVPLST